MRHLILATKTKKAYWQNNSQSVSLHVIYVYFQASLWLESNTVSVQFFTFILIYKCIHFKRNLFFLKEDIKLYFSWRIHTRIIYWSVKKQMVNSSK